MWIMPAYIGRYLNLEQTPRRATGIRVAEIDTGTTQSARHGSRNDFAAHTQAPARLAQALQSLR